MLTRHIYIILAISTALLWTFGATGCSATGSSESTDPIVIAQQAIDSGDYTAAAELLDEARNSQAEALDVERMVSMSIIYMKLADVSDSEEMVGYAYQCLSQAFATDSSATADYINTLTVEELAQAAAVKTLLGAAGMMSFHDDGEYPDSLFITDQESEHP